MLPLLFPVSGFAAPGDNTEEEEHNLRLFIPNVWEQEKEIWSAPLRARTWKNPGSWLFAGAMAGSFALDDGLSRNLRNNESFSNLNKMLASDSLEMATWIYPAAALGISQLVDNESLSDYGWKVSEGALNAFLVARTLKVTAGRERPHTGKLYDFWEGGNSFPSGHALISWTLAEITVKHYSDQKWLPWVAYPLAGLISFSRITSGHHYTSDVVTGSLIGFSIGHWAID